MILIDAESEKFYKLPYVAVRGWVGIELAHIDDDELTQHILLRGG